MFTIKSVRRYRRLCFVAANTIPCWCCYCAALACTRQTSTITKNLCNLARRRCGALRWRHENVETCSSIDYIQRHCCDLHFCYINCAFVGNNNNNNNKNNCPGNSATRVTVVQSKSKYKTCALRCAEPTECKVRSLNYSYGTYNHMFYTKKWNKIEETASRYRHCPIYAISS